MNLEICTAIKPYFPRFLAMQGQNMLQLYYGKITKRINNHENEGELRMPEKIVINTEKENNALIPDKWVVGTGLSTNSLYITHTDTPLMIVQHDLNNENDAAPCTVYVRGQIDPKLLNQLFNEAWELIEIYKTRFSDLKISPKDFVKSVE